MPANLYFSNNVHFAHRKLMFIRTYPFTKTFLF